MRSRTQERLILLAATTVLVLLLLRHTNTPEESADSQRALHQKQLELQVSAELARVHAAKERELMMEHSPWDPHRVTHTQPSPKTTAPTTKLSTAPSKPSTKKLSAEEIKALEDASFKRHWFNEYRSSLLPLDRPVPDIRVRECASIRYDLAALPKTSIIICFVDEAWSTLLRSVWSMVNRAPAELIQEIILVDDASNVTWLGENLKEYIAEYWPQKVRLIRSPKRLGLIRARLLGAYHAKGKVLTFMDSHVEANAQWLEPILAVIGKDRKTVVTPVIDVISDRTMDYESGISAIPNVGTFDWTLDFNWKEGVPAPGSSPADPVDSPTMAGGLFAIERDYFYEIGSYDDSMEGWGGENIEMSFRIWQCGGRLVTAPCSHVGHIFRSSHPYTVPNSTIGDTFLRNSARLAEVWMDDYKRYFYEASVAAAKVTVGDVSARRALRERLKCKSFEWYLKTVLPDKFIPDEKHVKLRGAIQSDAVQTCFDTMGGRAGGVMGLYGCHGMAPSQLWLYTFDEELRSPENLCIVPTVMNGKDQLMLQECSNRASPTWEFSPDRQLIEKRSRKCVTSNGPGAVVLSPCEKDLPQQRWSWTAPRP